jgi:hypothetical protein
LGIFLFFPCPPSPSGKAVRQSLLSNTSSVEPIEKG